MYEICFIDVFEGRKVNMVQAKALDGRLPKKSGVLPGQSILDRMYMFNPEDDYANVQLS